MIEEVVRLGIILLCTVSAVFVYADAQRRGMNAPLWALLVFLFSVVVLPVYFPLRKPLPAVSRVPIKARSGSDTRIAEPPRRSGARGICPR